MSTSIFSTDGLENPARARDFVVAVVQMERCPKESDPVVMCFDFCESLDQKLRIAKLGHYDGSHWKQHIRHFFHVDEKRLVKALELLKTGLKQRALLRRSAIASFDRNKKLWRVVHPKTRLLKVRRTA